MSDTFDVGVNNAPAQVYIILWHSHSDSGVLAVRNDRASLEQEWRKYLDNPMLINDFLNDTYLEYWVDEDPDDAIEVWDVK